MEQVQCLIVITQQMVISNEEDLLDLTRKLEEFTLEYPLDLFSILKDEAWSDSHNSVQIFKSWAFFPFQKLTQPFVTLKLEFVSESPYLYNYLLSAKYGNLLAQQCLCQLYKFEKKELQELARDYNVPKSLEKYSIQKYPFNLLQEDSSSLNSDPRIWCCNPMSPLITYEFESFKKYLFATEWYQCYLFNLGFRFKEKEEETKSKLKELNLALYYHFMRQVTHGMKKRIEYSKLAISNGIFEDVNLLLISKKVEESEKEYWKSLVNKIENK